MKFCKKCEKDTPTVKVGNNEECMVCGSEIMIPMPEKSNLSKKAMDDFKRITKKDESGQYTNSQKIGRNILIGILVILAGICYSIGGFVGVINGIVILIGGLVFLSIILYVVAMVED